MLSLNNFYQFLSTVTHMGFQIPLFEHENAGQDCKKGQICLYNLYAQKSWENKNTTIF